MKDTNIDAEKKYNKWIVILSIVIPVVVAVLFRVKLFDFGFDVEPLTFLPHLRYNKRINCCVISHSRFGN